MLGGSLGRVRGVVTGPAPDSWKLRMGWGLPSSVTVKSERVRPWMGLPLIVGDGDVDDGFAGVDADGGGG